MLQILLQALLFGMLVHVVLVLEHGRRRRRFARLQLLHIARHVAAQRIRELCVVVLFLEVAEYAKILGQNHGEYGQEEVVFHLQSFQQTHHVTKIRIFLIVKQKLGSSSTTYHFKGLTSAIFSLQSRQLLFPVPWHYCITKRHFVSNFQFVG